MKQLSGTQLKNKAIFSSLTLIHHRVLSLFALVFVEFFAFGVVLAEERADLAAKFCNYCVFGLSQGLEFFIFPAVEIVQAKL